MERYLGLVEEADRQGALELVAGLADGGVPVDRIVLDLLVPAQREVGRRWERGEWTVAHEHAATAIADAALALVTVGRGAPRTRGHVLVGCVEGEWHVLAARMAAEILRLRGWAVTFLGPSVPASDLCAYAVATEPDAIALSCSVTVLLTGAQRCIRACRDEGVPVLAGGAGFAPDGRYAAALGADAWEPDPVAGAGVLDGWLESPPPPCERGRLPGDDDRLLEAWRAELAAGALAALPARGGTDGRQSAMADGVDIALSAVQSAMLVVDPEVISAAMPMIERVMPDAGRSGPAASEVFEGLLPGLRRRVPGAAEFVERAIPALQA